MEKMSDLKLSDRTRGLSIVIDYLLTVAVILVVSTIVTAALTGAIESTEEEATEHELERVSGEVVAELHSIDAVMTRAEQSSTELESHRTAIELSGAFADQPVQFRVEGDPGEQDLIATIGSFRYRIALQLNREVVTDGPIVASIIAIECECEDGTIRIAGSGGTP